MENNTNTLIELIISNKDKIKYKGIQKNYNDGYPGKYRYLFVLTTNKKFLWIFKHKINIWSDGEDSIELDGLGEFNSLEIRRILYKIRTESSKSYKILSKYIRWLR